MFNDPAHYAKQILEMGGTGEAAVKLTIDASREWNLVPAQFWADVICEIRRLVAAKVGG